MYNNFYKEERFDPYLIARIIGLEDHALFHAFKKIGWAGSRSGGKSKRQDIEEAIVALERWLELESDEKSKDKRAPEKEDFLIQEAERWKQRSIYPEGRAKQEDLYTK